MMAWKVVVRSITLVAAVCCLAGQARSDSAGPFVGVTPPQLSFALPTNSTAPTAAQSVSVTITGTGSVTNFSTTIAPTSQGTGATDFVVTGTTCTGTLTAPAACTFSLTFSPSQPAGSLETATLGISTSAGGLVVNLNGAAGAIKLFDPQDVNASLPGTAGFPNGTAVRTTLVNLKSCPATPHAKLSSTPDGSGFVFQDNFIRVTVNPNTEGMTGPTNVCTGGDPNGAPPNGTNCFQLPYETDVTNYLGQDPDVATSTAQVDGQNNPFGTPLLPSFGVAPLDLSTLLHANNQVLKVEMVDAGGKLGSATLDLVTDCQTDGVQSGGSISSDPITPGSPTSLTPQYNYNLTTGNHVAFAADYLTGSPNITFADNTIQTSNDAQIVPANFPAMVAGTSAGPAVCMRYSGELDANNAPQCKAFTITCTIGQSADAQGTNCPQSTVRNILFKTLFDSPDTPTSQSQIAPGTGPGFLMGTDSWGNTICTFTDPNLLGEPCPQDILTSFIGGDPAHGGTTRSTNSTFVAVLNMPLPSTDTDLLSENFFGWQQSTTVNVRFEASPATYPVRANRHPLPANGFSPAPIQNVTFGTNSVTATPAVPDPTFPVKNDVVLPNGTCPNAPAGTFTQTQTLTTDTSTGNPFAEGRYNLHYFATDCASTEELRFTRSTSPTANWASFKTMRINIDHTAPSITATNVSFASGSRFNTVSVTLKCVDPVLTGDGTPGSGVIVCGPAIFFAVASTPSFRVKIPVGKTTHGSFQLPTFDLAFNTGTVTVTY